MNNSKSIIGESLLEFEKATGKIMRRFTPEWSKNLKLENYKIDQVGSLISTLITNRKWLVDYINKLHNHLDTQTDRINELATALEAEKQKQKRVLFSLNTEDKDGVALIGLERLEQLTKHKRDAVSDYENNYLGQLRLGAQALLKEYPSNRDCPKGWGFILWMKMCSKSQKERLIIAGALIAAEIDRLRYLAKHLPKKPQPKIIGYKAPFDMFGGGIIKGDVFVACGNPDFYEPQQNSGYSSYSAKQHCSFPKEWVETWEPVYEQTK